MRKKGGQKTYNGRVALLRPEHPFANKFGYVYRYRIVAEQSLGRYLLPSEDVHHKDGDKTNDDPSNLEVMTHAEHARMHGLCDGWSRKHRACVVCGRTDSQHVSRGRCNRCYHNVRRGIHHGSV